MSRHSVRKCHVKPRLGMPSSLFQFQMLRQSGGLAFALLAFLGNLAIAQKTKGLTGNFVSFKGAFVCFGIGVMKPASRAKPFGRNHGTFRFPVIAIDRGRLCGLKEVAMRKLMITALLMGIAGTVFAEEMRIPINADDLQWGPAPNAFPAGAQIAVISGNPFNEGLYVLRLKMPADYKIPAHSHPTSEYVTVLSGGFYIGMGDKLDPQQVVQSGSDLGYRNSHWSIAHALLNLTP